MTTQDDLDSLKARLAPRAAVKESALTLPWPELLELAERLWDEPQREYQCAITRAGRPTACAKP